MTVILHGKHPVYTKLLIHTEHLRLLHAGPLLISGSLGRRFHIVLGCRAIHSVSRRCVICRRRSLRPQPPLMGQLSSECVTPDLVFNQVEIVRRSNPHKVRMCKKTYSSQVVCVSLTKMPPFQGLVYDSAGSGSASNGLPIRKCPGVSTSNPCHR